VTTVDRTTVPTVVTLDEPAASRVALVGAKAANLALARSAGLPALPGIVLTTAWSRRELATAVAAWREVSDDGATAVVVRSSSTGEDGDASSMAGVFDSILDVADESGLRTALDRVLGSAERARAAGLVDADMAVLIQPMLRPAWGGVLFGADPVSGRRDRLVVAAVPGGPDRLVSGEADGWTGVLDRRGRVREVRSGADVPRPPAALLRRLARLADRSARAFGGPQDIEWAAEGDTLHLLQARPITTLPPRSGTVFGPGPVAESFPDPLSPLEQDLWLDPLRDGLREALRLAGVTPSSVLHKSALVIAVDGMAAVDLAALGVDTPAGGFLRKLDPRPPARRLRAAWRVGRLRSALPELALDLVDRIDSDLAAVPAVSALADHELLSVLRNGRRALVSLHGHEALTGLLIPAADAATVTGASLALAAAAQARVEGVAPDELVEHEPVVLALVPPRIGPSSLLEVLAAAPAAAAPPDAVPDPAAIAREALRLRIRWVQELMARAAWELAGRLADRGQLRSRMDVREVRADELAAAVTRRVVVLPTSGAAAGAHARRLPARFRLDVDGRPRAVPAPARRSRGAGDAGAVGAGGGRATAPVHVVDDGGEIPAGSILVVSHLDPRLATVIPRLAGLVAETGSPLSHLAILAREHGVATVVGVTGAASRFHSGDIATVDGHEGTVVVEPFPSDLVEAGVAA